MYQRIYIDIVFMTNFLMDYMLLRFVGKFLHLDGKRRRCVISAAFGSFVSCLLVCVPFKIIFPAAVLIHGGCAFFMASFAFRLKKGGLLVKTILALYFTPYGSCEKTAGIDHQTGTFGKPDIERAGEKTDGY